MRLALVPGALACLACAGHAARTPVTPHDGAELVTRMHDAYAGKWYRTVTFTQTTTQRGPDGRERVSTWHEALLAPATLRIDVGQQSEGNVVIYTADSSFHIRGGKLVRAAADANPFMPFVSSIYHVPVVQSLADLARWKFDLSKVRTETRGGRLLWVVGTTQASDTTSPQFWVDARRLVTTRIVLPAEGNLPALDISLGGYQPAGGGWIATDVDMKAAGKSVQREQYADVRADVELPVAMFDPHQFPVASVGASGGGGAETTVYIVRHAEKFDMSADAKLSAAGERRARVLADSLARRGIAGIITTQFQRTELTAEPLAQRLGITPVVVNAGAGAPDHVAVVVSTIRAQFAGKPVLVVGHSNTVPAIIRALGVTEDVTIPDDAYDDLFVVHARADGTATMTHSHYGEPSGASAPMR